MKPTSPSLPNAASISLRGHLIRPSATVFPSDAKNAIAADQKNVLGSMIAQKFKKAEAALCHRGKLQTTGPARQFWKEGGK